MNQAPIRGEMYKARKKSVGGDRGNQYTKVASAQNEHEPKGPNRTAEVIAKELGIGKETVKRSEKFHDGIDALRVIKMMTREQRYAEICGG